MRNFTDETKILNLVVNIGEDEFLKLRKKTQNQNTYNDVNISDCMRHVNGIVPSSIISTGETSVFVKISGATHFFTPN